MKNKTTLLLALTAALSLNAYATDAVFGDTTNGQTAQEQMDAAVPGLQATYDAALQDHADALTASTNADNNHAAATQALATETAEYEAAAATLATEADELKAAQEAYLADNTQENADALAAAQTEYDAAELAAGQEKQEMETAEETLGEAEMFAVISREALDQASATLSESSDALAAGSDINNYTDIKSDADVRLAEMAADGHETLYDKADATEDKVNEVAAAVDTKVDQAQYDADKVQYAEDQAAQDVKIEDNAKAIADNGAADAAYRAANDARQLVQEEAIYANTYANQRQDAQLADHEGRINLLEQGQAQLRKDLNALEDRVDGTQAMTMAALSSTAQIHYGQTSSIGFGVGTAGDAQALAIGGAYRITENWTGKVHVAATIVSGDFEDVAAGAGVAYSY